MQFNLGLLLVFYVVLLSNPISNLSIKIGQVDTIERGPIFTFFFIVKIK